jgi:SAM-dependent methyltransferase
MKADHCRGCGSARLVTLHDFGLQPLAGVYPTVPESEARVRRYRLDLTQCGACGLLQVLNLPPIGEVFHDDYRYSSSTVPGLVRHFDGYANWLHSRLPSGAHVFEFGCNDGVLLQRLQRLGFSCTGVDASNNVASIARGKGLTVVTGFLTPELARSVAGAGRFDLVTCSNVFAHIHDLRDTLEAVRVLLAPGGMFAIEVHDGDLLATEGQFDTVYHEHLTYFTTATLRGLVERNGFEFVECERTPMHGGGLRFVARRSNSPVVRAPAGNAALLDDFVEPQVTRCRADLERLHAQHGPLTGYGAAGRSQMFVNFTGSARLFDRVYDDSPFRQGRYVAGTDVPIVPYAGQRGRCAVVLAWNYAPDIAARIADRFDSVVTLLPALKRW